MDIFDIVSNHRPQDALALLRQYSRSRVESQADLADGLRSVVHGLPEGQQEEFLIELSNLHPDAQLFREINQSDMPSSFNRGSCAACNTMPSPVTGSYAEANGQQAVNHYMSTGPMAKTIDDQSSLSKEIDALKNNNQSSKEIDDKIFKIVVILLIAYLIHKIYLKDLKPISI